MSTIFVFLGILLVSLAVSFLAALQLADFFQATEEFIVVLMALAAFNLTALLIFALAYSVTRRVGALAAIAALLCIAVCAAVAVPSIIDAWNGRETLTDSIFGQNLAVSLEILIPAIVTVMVQWGLTRHRWLRMLGRNELSPWPWVTTAAASLLVLSPPGLAVIAAAVKQAPTDWFRQLWATVTICGAAAVLLAGLIEYYVRKRMLRRRLAAKP